MAKKIDLEKLAEEGLEDSVELMKIPVKIKEKDGKVTPYFLMEMDGIERDNYMKLMKKRLKHDATGRIIEGQMDTDGMFAVLLSMTLINRETNERPTVEQVQRWPSSLQKKYFLISQQMSGLTNDEEEEAKND